MNALLDFIRGFVAIPLSLSAIEQQTQIIIAANEEVG